MVKDRILGSGSSVTEAAYLGYLYEWGKWHRSQERIAGVNPFASFLMNKKWTLGEEFNNHMLRFQQVIVIPIFVLLKTTF